MGAVPATFLDLFAAKVALQLGLLDAPSAVGGLQALDQGAAPDLPQWLARTRGVPADKTARVDRMARRCMFLKGEVVYLRLLRDRKLVDEEALRPFLLKVRQVVEKDLRLGGLLVEARKLAPEVDRELATQGAEMLERDNVAVADRFRKASYAGIDQNMQTVAEVIQAADQAALASASTPSRPLPAPPRPIGVAASPEATFGLQPGPAKVVPAERATQQLSPLSESAVLNDSNEKTSEFQGKGGAAQPDDRRSASSASEPLPPELIRTGLDEKYHIGKKLGEGGMGAVYLAWAKDDEKRERPMALKVVLDGAKTADASARFKREILATSFCSDEHVIEIYDAAETKDGSFYMAMECIVGEQLDELLKREGPLPLTRLVPLIEQVLLGLDAIHRANIVHRDIKPQNFRIYRDPAGRERVKIMDFGIARVLDAEDSGAGEQFYTTMAGKITGSPAYIAPESITEPQIDQRADLYSLGIAIVRVATGRLPFVAKDPNEFLPMHLYKKPPLLRELLPDAPVEMEAFVSRLLEKAPNKRTPSAADALVELRQKVMPALGLSGGLNGGGQAAPAPTTAQPPGLTATPPPASLPAIPAMPTGFEATAADAFPGAAGPIVAPTTPQSTPAPAATPTPQSTPAPPKKTSQIATAETADELEPARPSTPAAEPKPEVVGTGPFSSVATANMPAQPPAKKGNAAKAVFLVLLAVVILVGIVVAVVLGTKK